MPDFLDKLYVATKNFANIKQKTLEKEKVFIKKKIYTTENK
jgi:hypothetical protein